MRFIKFLRCKTYIIITTVLRLIITLGFSAMVAYGFTLAAYNIRGYSAIGGEWIAIIALTVVCWKLTGYAAKAWWAR